VSAAQELKIAVKNAIGFSGVKEKEILAGPARGVRMELDFAGQTPKYIGMFEWELHAFYRKVLPGSRVIFDVGGAEGYCALLYAANSPGKVFSFEPNPSEVERLRANIDRNPELRDRLVVRKAAVGRENGDGTVTIDQMADEVGAPDFIKVDVDGFELDVLTGGQRTLREKRPHLVVETHTRVLEDQCGALLVECGYRPVIKHNREIWKETRGGSPHNRWLLAAGRPDGV
jgi:methyltransferase FkbM-like protein